MNNIKKIQHSLCDYDFDAMLIASPASRIFTGGFASSAGAYLITADAAWFFVDPRYVEAAKEKISGAEILLITKDETLSRKIGKLVQYKGIASVGFEESWVTYSLYLELEKQLKVPLKPGQKLINDLRAIKSREDLDGMIKAQRIAEKSLEEIMPLINNDITERELAAKLVYQLIKNGADDKAFDPIIVSGPRSSLPHGVPTNEKIENGFLTIDWGARVDGWCSDCTRTFSVGEPTEEMIKIYGTVLKAQNAGIDAVCANASCKDVDTAARTVIEDAGYGEYFGHGFGHGLGLEVHESLRASQLSNDILPAGAVLTAEPGIYLPGKYGVRIEDTIFVTESGCENITKFPKNLIVI